MSPSQTPELVELEPQTFALLREVVPMDALPPYFDRAFHAVASVLGAQGLAIAGPPVGVYFGMPTDTVDVGAGFPTDRPITDADGVTGIVVPGGRAVQVLHVGSYDTMEATYDRLMAWVGAEQLTPGPLMWEAYLTEPDPAAPEATQTLIVWPLAS